MNSEQLASLRAAVRQGLVDQHMATARMLREMADGTLGRQDGATALLAVANVIERAATQIASDAP